MKDNITIGEKYRPAMEITDPGKAEAYFEECVQHCMGHGKTRSEAERIERGNLGYFAGYYSADVRSRVEFLFGSSHPVFGSIRSNGEPTAEEALNAGKGAEVSGTNQTPEVANAE